jgi:hypothetical protein
VTCGDMTNSSLRLVIGAALTFMILYVQLMKIP